VVNATLYVFLPPAPSPLDNEAWVDVYYAAKDKHGQVFLSHETASKFILRTIRPGDFHPLQAKRVKS